MNPHARLQVQHRSNRQRTVATRPETSSRCLWDALGTQSGFLRLHTIHDEGSGHDCLGGDFHRAEQAADGCLNRSSSTWTSITSLPAMLPGMSKFRQHNVYRDWEFEKADEDLPSSLILDQDPDDRLSEGGRARKKRRIEDHGFNFIKGRPIYIQSARMRGPFGASWVNPWLETGTLARNEGKGTRGKEGGARPPELRESGIGRGGAEESKNREPRVKPSRPVPARKVSPIEGSDIPPQPHMLSASHPVHRRQSSNASDRTLDWLRQQKAHRHTPEQNDDSFFALGPTPSRPPRSSISRPNISDRMGTSKSSGQKGSRLRKMPSDSAGHKQGEQYRSSGSVDAQRETDIDHAENVDTPTHNKADKKRIATSRGMVLRDDPAPFAVEVMQTSIVKAASVSKAKRSEPPMSSANVLQPRIQNKSLLISKVVSESNVFKPSVNEDMVHGDVEQGVKRSRALSHKSTDEAGLIVAKPLIQKATEHILKPPGADDTIHHPHEEPELISRANSEGRASVARHLTRSAVQQSAERCGTHVSRRKSSSSQKRHEINKTVAVATTKEAMNLLSTNPPKAVNTRLQHLKHPHNASPLTSRDSPGFAYRRVSIHGQDSPTHAEESALIGADGGPHLIAAQSKIGDELIGDLPTGTRASYQDGSAAEADSPVFGTGGVARSATGPKSEMQQGHRRQTPLEEMDVDKMTPAQRWAFIERYTNREIPDDGDSPTNKNSTRARLRRAMRASGASFMTVDNDEKGITDAEVVQKSPSGERLASHRSHQIITY